MNYTFRSPIEQKGRSPYLGRYHDLVRNGTINLDDVRYQLAGSEPPISVSDWLGEMELPDGKMLATSEFGGGSLQLRTVVASQYGMTPDQTFVLEGGCSAANFHALNALLRPGDAVLAEVPTYDPMPSIVRDLVGVRQIPLPRREENQFQVDLDEFQSLLLDDVRLITLVSPSNPTGAVIKNLPELLEIVEQENKTRARKIYVVVDQIFNDLTIEEWPIAATLSPWAITTLGYSKCYKLSGMKCGVILANTEVINAALGSYSKSVCAVSSFLQAVWLEFFSNRRLKLRQELLSLWLSRRELAIKLCSDLGLSFIEPDGGSILTVKTNGKDDVEVSRLLLEEEKVLVVPGSFFYYPGTLRIGFFAPAEEELREGLDRVASVLK